jgi:hypothetical protein
MVSLSARVSSFAILSFLLSILFIFLSLLYIYYLFPFACKRSASVGCLSLIEYFIFFSQSWSKSYPVGFYLAFSSYTSMGLLPPFLEEHSLVSIFSKDILQ